MGGPVVAGARDSSRGDIAGDGLFGGDDATIVDGLECEHAFAGDHTGGSLTSTDHYTVRPLLAIRCTGITVGRSVVTGCYRDSCVVLVEV